MDRKNGTMSTCERMQSHLNDFLDGTLGSAQAQVLNAHLQECGECRREYHALHATRDLVRNIAVPDGVEAQQRVMTRFRQQIRTESARVPVTAFALPLTWRMPVLGFGAAVGVAMALLLIFVPRLHTSTRQTSVGNGPIILATAACESTLPTADALDEMTSAHAVQSLSVQNGSEEPEHEALADANSRLSLDKKR
jgi:predicted anti-sigma-YlaC factor YlaD